MEFIKESYVSIEIAKMLEEKGFNDYYPKGNCLQYAATQQIVMRWLREVHHYYIQVMLDSWALGDHSGYYIVIQRTDNDFEMMLQNYVNEVFYQTYEEAVEAALKYCLENLI